MNIKQYKESRMVSSLTKVKDLCKLLFNEVLTELTEAQVTALDEALKNAGEAVKQLTGVDDSGGKLEKFGENKIETRPPESYVTETSKAVIEILGERNIRRTTLVFLNQMKEDLRIKKYEQDKIIFQAEQAFYRDLSGYQNINISDAQRRMNLASCSSVEAIKNHQSEDTEECELLESVLELMVELGM